MAHNYTSREINRHVANGQGSCYVDLPNGKRIRISRTRMKGGRMEGRVIHGSDQAWEAIPPDSRIELH